MEKILDKKNKQAQTAVIGDVTLKMSMPDSTQPEWIGQTEVLKQILACWLVVGEKDFPLFRSR